MKRKPVICWRLAATIVSICLLCGCGTPTQRIQDATARLSGQIAKSAAADKFKVGVFPFLDRSGKAADFALLLTDTVTTELQKDGRVTIVPYLDSQESRTIREELRRQAQEKSDKAIDPETVQDISHKWGVDAVLFGWVEEAPESYCISCRLYRAATGAGVAGAAETVYIDKQDLHSPQPVAYMPAPDPLGGQTVVENDPETEPPPPSTTFYLVNARYYFWMPSRECWAVLPPNAYVAPSRVRRVRRLPSGDNTHGPVPNGSGKRSALTPQPPPAQPRTGRQKNDYPNQAGGQERSGKPTNNER